MTDDQPLPDLSAVRALDPDARLLDLAAWDVLDVTASVEPVPLRAVMIIEFGDGWLIRTAGDTDWWMGQPDRDAPVLRCWGTYGSDLRRAFDAL